MSIRPAPQDTVILLLLAALLLFAPPLLYWWARPGSPWYLVFLLWGGLIALIALAQRLRGRHDV